MIASMGVEMGGCCTDGVVLVVLLALILLVHIGTTAVINPQL